MNIKYILALLVLIPAAIFSFVLYISRGTFTVLAPQGVIAMQERTLMVDAALMMLLVVVPVFILTFWIAWRYRAGNTKARYTPNWEHNLVDEFIWWVVPAVIIAALAILTWQSSHQLDPFKPLSSATPPITIQVVALNWKWLFIYPDQGIAAVNYVEFPAGTPINFQITADAPMNSFWIPQLGGQIYAMTGMVTQLHLMASSAGEYSGVSANFSGAGFAGMQFEAHAVSQNDFQAWVAQVRRSSQTLNPATYAALAAPSENVEPAYFASTTQSLFSTIVSKFMPAMGGMQMQGMEQ